MSIRESIRKAFKRVDEDDHAEEIPVTISSIREFLQKAGYALYDVDYIDGKVELFINSRKPKHLHPKIFHNYSDGVFEVRVVEQGLIGASDLEEVIKGYENALAVVQYLDSIDLDRLKSEINLDDEEE